MDIFNAIQRKQIQMNVDKIVQIIVQPTEPEFILNLQSDEGRKENG